jgi:two-component system, chemotaxis family, CheB/CheR fusion protein
MEQSDAADQTAIAISTQRSAPTVVGIGASAGGLEALKTFFAHLGDGAGMAFVIVMHLSPDHESHLADILQPHVKMPVQQVTQSTPLKANHVYVIPPNSNLSTIDTHLRPTKLEEHRRERAPIDHFFRTLARVHDGHCIGIVLSGTGSDGTLGIKEIKERNGLVVVQDPNEAEFDGMPQSAIATGFADLVLPLAEMPKAIERFALTHPRLSIPQDDEAVEEQTQTLLKKVLSQVRTGTGRDFSQYKPSTILRRIQRRMQLRFTEEMSDYLDVLREDPTEVRDLADDFLITVTNFFRDKEVFLHLEEEIIPSLFEDKEPGETLRVWSVGCATGEEAYSIAILLLEAAARTTKPPHLQVFATDLHEHSLDKAREGFYPGDIEAVISKERLARFFHKEDGGYRIRPNLREMVVFAPHNLLSDPPFSRLDLISCRNLMIYLRRAIQQEVIDLFHYVLKPDGVLVLGSSETVDDSELFSVENKSYCIYRKRNVPAPDLRLPVFPLIPSRRPAREKWPRDQSSEPIAYGALHHQLVEMMAPPSMLVSPDHKVVHLSEHAGRYLVPQGGDFTASVFDLVREELRIELVSALQAAVDRGVITRSRPINVQLEGRSQPVILSVRPCTQPRHEGYSLVIFDEWDEPLEASEEVHGATSSGQENGRSVELGAELDMTRQRLRSVIQEYETSQEEMRASNEELQSANEELRSTLEELETSKEELQGMNEELQSVNQENRHRVAELAKLTADLQNLMAATEIATLFLDRDLGILRFTPKVGELFNIRVTDRGRPLSDITHRLGYPELEPDAKHALERLEPVEREVQDDAGRTFLTRVLPYRSVHDQIDGVVVTFVDITQRIAAERARRESEERFTALIEASAQMVWMTDPGGQFAEDSSTWRSFTGQTFEESRGRGWLDAIHPDDRDDTEAGWLQALEEGALFKENFRVRHAASKTYRWTTARAVPLHSADGTVRGWVGMNIDVSELKGAEEALQKVNKTLEERVRQVRDLARRLTMTEQEERRRISQILHDDLQQLLFAVRMKMTGVEARLGVDMAPAVEEALHDVGIWLERAITITRQLTVDFSPPILQNEGLADALEWLQSQMEELHGMTVTIEAQEEVVIPDEDIRVLLFQIVRELLFNVKKHAGVEQARVELSKNDGELAIHVIDEGVGFDVDAKSKEQREGGFGLFSVRERLSLLDGRLVIASRPGGGTRVSIYVPSDNGSER